VKAWLKNLLTLHHRIMMRYLQKRGWVVFYLEPKNRICGKDCCWLELYEKEMLEKR